MVGGEWKPGDKWEDWKPLPGRPRLSSVEACELERWHLMVWPTGGEAVGQPIRRPFLCGSWRCRRCAAWRGAVDFRRCAAGVSSRPWWLYCVLTFDPKGFAGPFEAFKEAGRCWDDHLREALRHKAGKVAYLQTWEATKGGWPHVNLMLSGDGLREVVEAEGVERVEHRGRARAGLRGCLFPKGFRRWLRGAAMRAGFGPVAWAEVLSPGSGDAMAGYLVKLAKELTGAKMKKGDQSPLHAPKHFRRIRASRGILPPAHKGTGEWTGALARGRVVRAPTGERRPGHKPERVAATWDDVRALQEHLAREAKRLGKAWGDGEVSVLREGLSHGTQLGKSPVFVAPRPGEGDLGRLGRKEPGAAGEEDFGSQAQAAAAAAAAGR